jgi:excisionase family DNA binding protein
LNPTAGCPLPRDPLPVWLSTAKAAEWLGITPRTPYTFIDTDQIPAYRFGRVIRLQQNDDVPRLVRSVRRDVAGVVARSPAQFWPSLPVKPELDLAA